MDIYGKIIKEHYKSVWGNGFKERTWDKGPIDELYNRFTILEFEPTSKREMWTYATCGMSTFTHKIPIELHLFSAIQDYSILELLTSIAYYHNVEQNIDLGHTVNFGKPWQGASKCSYGLISLPYLDGPDLELLYPGDDYKTIFCYWLIPISLEERDYKVRHGLEALEDKFDEARFNYLDSGRESVV